MLTALFSLIGLISVLHASPKPFEVRKMITEKKYDAAEEAIAKALARVKSPQEAEPWMFIRLWAAVDGGQNEAALAAADSMLENRPLLEEEIRSLRARVLERMGRRSDVIEEDRKLLELSPNLHLRFEAMLRSGRLHFSASRFRDARNVFAALEKRARGTPDHAEVVYELLRAERKVGSANTYCRWARKLYASKPTFPAVAGWSSDLASNEVDGERLGCPNSKDNFHSRIRNLLWNGEDERANSEVQTVVQAIARDNRGDADEMKAWYLLQTGDPDEAFDLLQALYPERKSSGDFLSLYASAAARSGRVSAAIGAYQRIYESASRSDVARKSLYQAAFLSYQFRDYDGASRRFQEFMRKYPRSGLTRDARWNLAWISYLKGDFEGALKKFKAIAGDRRQPASLRDRTRYWMAMSHLRLDQPKAAQPLLATVAADRSGSYYGALARQRLQAMSMNVPSTILATAEPQRNPAATEPASSGADAAEETESEEALAAEAMTVPEEKEEPEEASSDLAQETGRSDVIDDLPTPKAPANAKRFEKAKMLLALGFMDQARWELYEIERRTRGRDELRALLTMYEEAGQFHRSSSIAQLRFGGVRQSQGYDGARALWEAAYPRAYIGDVKAGARDNSLPSEFIWGIMKAESQFKRDAISPVGALGLMQIMPATGRRIASLRRDSSFQPEMLLQPPVAIRYGSFYLRRLSSSFDNSIPLAAAAYNAGPHRVHSWLLSFGSLGMDEFIEHIPFLETREYVRRVVGNALVYESLYGGRSSLVNLTVPVPVKGRAEWSRKENWD